MLGGREKARGGKHAGTFPRKTRQEVSCESTPKANQLLFDIQTTFEHSIGGGRGNEPIMSSSGRSWAAAVSFLARGRRPYTFRTLSSGRAHHLPTKPRWTAATLETVAHTFLEGSPAVCVELATRILRCLPCLARNPGSHQRCTRTNRELPPLPFPPST